MRRSAMPVTDLNCVQQLVCELVVGIEIVSHDLNVDRRGKAEIQNLADDVGRREIEQHAGKFLGQLQAQDRGCIRPSAGASRTARS